MHTRTTRRQFRLQRQTFSIWRPCWRPYWISRLAIIYANLCRQFQKLQTIGNILIYDTFCCTWGGWEGGGGGVRVTPRKSGQFHSLSPYHIPNLNVQSSAMIGAPPWVSHMLQSLDSRLQQIEKQLVNQNTNWQNVDMTLHSQNIRMTHTEKQISELNSVKQNVAKVERSVCILDKDARGVNLKLQEYDESIPF